MWTRKTVEYLWKTSAIPIVVNETSNVSNISDLTSPEMNTVACSTASYRNHTMVKECLTKSVLENPYENHDINTEPLGTKVNLVDLHEYPNTGNYESYDD